MDTLVRDLTIVYFSALLERLKIMTRHPEECPFMSFWAYELQEKYAAAIVIAREL